MNIALLYNPAAGRGKASSMRELLERQLKLRGVVYKSFAPPWPDHFEGYTSIWIAGGDGTIHYFVNRYPDITLPIALFKGGSGNDFAWKLYGSISPLEYFEMALLQKGKSVDAGVCNGQLFMNGAGIGFDGEVVSSMRANRILPGHVASLMTVLKKIFWYREKDITIDSGRGISKEKVFMISIANGSRYGGGFMVAPHAKLDDGLLDLVMIKKIAPLKRIFYLPKVEKGKHLHLRFIEYALCKSVLIESPWPVKAHLDGELLESTRFDISVLPGKFQFIC